MFVDFAGTKLRLRYQISLFLLIASNFFYSSISFAQTPHKISGIVIDSASTAISDTNVLLVTGTDTLRTITDKSGKFHFKAVKSGPFTLNITSLGYQPHISTHKFDKNKKLELTSIVLAVSGTLLKEVIVHAKIDPVRAIWRKK